MLGNALKADILRLEQSGAISGDKYQDDVAECEHETTELFRGMNRIYIDVYNGLLVLVQFGVFVNDFLDVRFHDFWTHSRIVFCVLKWLVFFSLAADEKRKPS